AAPAGPGRLVRLAGSPLDHRRVASRRRVGPVGQVVGRAGVVRGGGVGRARPDGRAQEATKSRTSATTSGERRIRLCPSPVVTLTRAPGQAAATAAPSVTEVDRSLRSWMTRAGGIDTARASSGTSKWRNGTLTRRSVRGT